MLLPFGQKARITHQYLKGEVVWITDARLSYFIGHDWQYKVRTDKRLHCGYFLWGGAWFDEMYLEPLPGDGVVPSYLNISEPETWPPVDDDELPPDDEPEQYPTEWPDFGPELAALDGVIGQIDNIKEQLSSII